MKTLRPELNILNFSDIHLLHRTTPTAFIINNLEKLTADPVVLDKLDMICITGDVFDNRGTLSDPSVPRIQEWMANLLKKAKRHDIAVRVLKGTPLHDWEQSQLWESINAIADIGADLKYVKTVSIEYIERYGITMLYVPDEANTTTEKTLSQVRELMHAKGLDKVDFAMMHGQFDFQLPAHVHAQKHDSTAYLELVREIIMVGHVHTYNRFDRIIPPGSFDRLTHGQEEAKGSVWIRAKTNFEYDVEFRENLGAKKYITVPCKGLTLAETNALIDQYVQGLPAESHVRVEADKDNPILTNMQEVMLRHPLFYWSKISRKEKKEQEEAAITQESFTQPALTKDNLGDLLLKRVVDKNPHPVVLAAVRRLMEKVL